MVNFEMLRNKIEDSGMTVTSISKKSGILRETLYNRMKGRGEFTASEIVALTQTLRLTNEERDRIFFTSKVELNETWIKVKKQTTRKMVGDEHEKSKGGVV